MGLGSHGVPIYTGLGGAGGGWPRSCHCLGRGDTGNLQLSIRGLSLPPPWQRWLSQRYGDKRSGSGQTGAGLGLGLGRQQL